MLACNTAEADGNEHSIAANDDDDGGKGKVRLSASWMCASQGAHTSEAAASLNILGFTVSKLEATLLQITVALSPSAQAKISFLQLAVS